MMCGTMGNMMAMTKTGRCLVVVLKTALGGTTNARNVPKHVLDRVQKVLLNNRAGMASVVQFGGTGEKGVNRCGPCMISLGVS